MMINVLRSWSVVVAIVALVLSGGCSSSEPTGSVSGKVTLDDKPLTAGVVSFISEAGFSAIGNIGSDGSFTLDQEVPPGSYRVSVSPPELTEVLGPDAELPESPIPEGYFDETSTDIVQEIKEGENTVTIALKSSGPAEGGAGAMEVAP